MADHAALERRIVSVLFADLVGFTTLSEEYDAEDVAAIQDRYFAAVRETIARYGGRLEKFIGDAAMAVFGVPRARDDDAVRAVRAGLALIHAIQQLGVHLGFEEGTLELRVGINTGEAVTAESGPDEGRVTGDTVNTAARLQTAAPPGRVMLGPTTALAVADSAELEPPVALELKGKAEPVHTRLVVSMRAEPSREEAMGALHAPTLGRQSELATLERALARTRAGAVERWLVVAPPGVGKSRLLREFEARADSGLQTAPAWRVRARADSVSPFEPIAGLLRTAAGSAADRRVAERTLRERAASHGLPPGRARVVADACLALGWPLESVAETNLPNDDRATQFAAWLDGFDSLAAGGSQLWLVEDVHWTGGDVLAFLDLAGSRAAAGGRLVLATARPSLLESAGWATDEPGAGRHVLQLPTLPANDARELVAALVGNALPAELVERIAERSDGNCLFIEELLRTWVSVGTLVETGSEWRLALPADEIPLPASVQSIYAAQLDDLPPDARRLARRASVAGRRFPLGALEPLEAAGEGLPPLQRRELLVGPIDEPLFGDAFAYRHALLRDAGYASLARAERARLHVRLARWLEQAAGEHAPEVAEQIAGHYSAALDSAPALAREIDDGLGRAEIRGLAAGWYERAGQGALAVSAHDAARQLLRRSIELTPTDSPLEQARRWARLGDATAFAADMDEGARAYEKAIELYRSALEEPGQAQSGLASATAALAKVWYQQLRFSDARDLATKTLEELSRSDDVSRARLLMARGLSSLGASGPGPQAAADIESALELARSAGDEQAELDALTTLTLMRHESGKGDPSDWERVAAFARRLGRVDTAITAQTNRSLPLIDDHAADAIAAAAETRELALSHGRREAAGWCDYQESEAAFVLGDWDRAIRAGARAMDAGEANAYLRLTVRTVHVMVPIASVRGERSILERAAVFYAGLVGKFEFPDSPYSRVVRPAQDLELAAAGLMPPFDLEVEPRLVAFEGEPGGASWTAALDRVFRAWLAAGEIDGAARALAVMGAALPKYTNVSSLGKGTVQLLRARLMEAQQQPSAAAEAAHAALAEFRVSGAPWWMAKALRVLDRIGSAEPALLSEALEIERLLGTTGPTR